MNIQQIALSQITPYARNAKKHPKAQIDKIALQISQVGFLVPIIVDKNFIIVAGHGRFEAARALNMDTVPVLVAEHLTEDQTTAFRIADNKVAESEWDLPVLSFELGTLDRSGFDLKLTGIDLDECARLMKSLNGTDPAPAASQGTSSSSHESSSSSQAGPRDPIMCPACGHEF